MSKQTQTLKYLIEEEKLLTQMSRKLEQQLNCLKVEEIRLIENLTAGSRDTQFTEKFKKFARIGGDKVSENIEAVMTLKSSSNEPATSLTEPLELEVSKSLLCLASGQQKQFEEEDDDE